jgi:hypothetical protein
MDQEHINRIKEARLKYKPDEIKCLFVAEAPPAASDRFFYFEDVSEQDSLYLEMMKVLFEDVTELPFGDGSLTFQTDVSEYRQKKAEYLQRFKGKGYFLVDNLDYPMPYEHSRTKDKISYLERVSPIFIEKIKSLIDKETPIVLISVPVYRANYAKLKYNGFKVLHDAPIEFPGSGQQKNFRDKMKQLLDKT